MARLKLPAYGKRLLDERRAGIHPLSVMLVYGDKWREVDPPKVCILPAEYEPGKYDFHMLAGLHVTVFDQANGAQDSLENARPPTYGKFYDLLGELAAADAWVDIEWPRELGLSVCPLWEMAWANRWFDRAAQRIAWPRWWNDALQAKHEHRWNAWHLRFADGRTVEHERGRAA